MTPISLVLLLGSSLLASALPAQVQFSVQGTPHVDGDPCLPDTPLTPGGVYYGSQKKDETIPTRLRISNGGAGLSGLVERLANRFIDDQLKNDSTPFKIEWIKGDTTETLHYLETGQADVGITYNKAAECQALSDHVAGRREYGFRDHFYLVGPGKNNQTENPAQLRKYDQANPEGILQQLQKIVRTGNNPPNNGTMGTVTRFLSRYDKSATNIKDSELFIRVGQVPWGLAYSKWYHQYTMYPRDALTAAALLKEYTITDRGTWLSTDSSVTDALEIYNSGADKNSTDPLLNPAFFLSRDYTGSKCKTNKKMADKFLNWIIDKPGQNAVKTFKAGSDKPCKLGSSKSGDPFGDCLYTVAPPIDKKSPIQDCKNTGL